MGDRQSEWDFLAYVGGILFFFSKIFTSDNGYALNEWHMNVWKKFHEIYARNGSVFNPYRHMRLA